MTNFVSTQKYEACPMFSYYNHFLTLQLDLHYQDALLPTFIIIHLTKDLICLSFQTFSSISHYF